MYSCIFFDLDHTLWDYETNSRQTLDELYQHYNLATHGVPDADQFHQRFQQVNTQLWDLYDRGLIDSSVIRKERFKQILEAFNAYEPGLSQNISHDYLYSCPQKTHLIPHAIEMLTYLSGKYTLTVVTNGFEEIQHQKLKAGNIGSYFNHIVTSQRAGHKKPAREIFDYAMRANSVECHQVIMVGDNLATDIAGARNAAINTVFFNPDQRTHNDVVTHEIQHLSQLRELL